MAENTNKVEQLGNVLKLVAHSMFSSLPKEEVAQKDAIFKLGLKETTLEEILPKMQTGDVLLMSGHWDSSSRFKIGCHSPFSHAALVIFHPNRPGVPLMYESTYHDTLIDVEQNICRQGTQIVPVAERFKSYWGYFIYCPLTVERTPEMLTKLEEFRQNHLSDAYEQSKLEFFKALFRANKRADVRSVFCSELVAATLQAMGVLDDKLPSNNFWPGDFISPSLKLLNGATIGSPVLIKREEVPSHLFTEHQWLRKMHQTPEQYEFERSNDLLQIHLIRGENLGLKTQFDKVGKPDFLVDFYIGLEADDDEEPFPNFRKVRSKVIEESHDPEWNEKLVLTYPPNEIHKFRFRAIIYDSDDQKTPKAKLSSVTLEPEEWNLETGKPVTFSKKLDDGGVLHFALLRFAKQ